MPASSVTGIGQGSADKQGQRGSDHLWVGVDKLIGPRIVQAGIGQVSVGTGTSAVVANAATIKFAQSLDGVLTDYGVQLTTLTSAAAYATVTGTTVDTAGRFSGFSVLATGSTSATFYWTVVKNTTATVGVPSNLWALT